MIFLLLPSGIRQKTAEKV